MKLEIEIPEKEIANLASEKIKVIVRDFIQSYWIDGQIKDTVRKLWDESLDSFIKEELDNKEEIRKQIRVAIVNKMKARLEKIMKEEENGHS